MKVMGRARFILKLSKKKALVIDRNKLAQLRHLRTLGDALPLSPRQEGPGGGEETCPRPTQKPTETLSETPAIATSADRSRGPRPKGSTNPTGEGETCG